MHKNLIIGIVAIVGIVAGILFFSLQSAPVDEQANQNAPVKQNDQAAVVPGADSSNANIAVSEKPNTAKFEEYFDALYLAKIANNEVLNYSAIPQASLSFVVGRDQFCTVVEPKKIISAGTYASAIYNVNTKTYVKPKTVFPGTFDPMLNAGCGSIPAQVGKYEYKAYLGNTLVMVLPFEIK
ncbi:MAG: hypothetical protein UW32_C0001G0213 [Candidatus Wolfebacteria bacterium GW2011_GWE2_44_13]|uniref:Uncharacterized protein n=1 Tax=Candidatus Wolfebacteria bacterium GW2011_GWE2_44_13 TaxID=1619017 RepID=A0A0G1H8D1_9BACT|nr:MAG: hypothetical protein UW32_C0001G0213 [Candidatus Wolfebacteria bacterium GW2011_GWE2_44_13]